MYFLLRRSITTTLGYAGSEADDPGPCRALELSSSVTTLLFEVVEPATKKKLWVQGLVLCHV